MLGLVSSIFVQKPNNFESQLKPTTEQYRRPIFLERLNARNVFPSKRVETRSQAYQLQITQLQCTHSLLGEERGIQAQGKLMQCSAQTRVGWARKGLRRNQGFVCCTHLCKCTRLSWKDMFFLDCNAWPLAKLMVLICRGSFGKCL